MKKKILSFLVVLSFSVSCLSAQANGRGTLSSQIGKLLGEAKLKKSCYVNQCVCESLIIALEILSFPTVAGAIVFPIMWSEHYNPFPEVHKNRMMAKGMNLAISELTRAKSMLEVVSKAFVHLAEMRGDEKMIDKYLSRKEKELVRSYAFPGETFEETVNRLQLANLNGSELLKRYEDEIAEKSCSIIEDAYRDLYLKRSRAQNPPSYPIQPYLDQHENNIEVLIE